MPFNSTKDGSHGLAPPSSQKPWEIQAFKEDLMKTYGMFTIEQRSRAISIFRSLAMAYAMDQVISIHVSYLELCYPLTISMK